MLLGHKAKSCFFYLQPTRSYYLKFVSYHFFYFIFWNFNFFRVWISGFWILQRIIILIRKILFLYFITSKDFLETCSNKGKCLTKSFSKYLSCWNMLGWLCIVNSYGRMCKIKFSGRRTHPTTIFLTSKVLRNWDIINLECMAHLLCCTVDVL